MRKKHVAIAASGIGFLFVIAVFVGAIQLPFDIMPKVSHTGVIVFYSEGFASDDTTDYDAAGTLEIFSIDGQLMEPALTLGTDTETTKEYTSGQQFYFVWKSTTANAWDHYSVQIILPFSTNDVNPLYELQWSSGDGYWIITCKMAIETTPTLLGYTIAGVVWSATGTKVYDLSDNNYIVSGTLKVAVAVNYGGLVNFYDPEEEIDGIWDKLYITADSNITAANVGFDMAYDGWQTCNDGEGWFYEISLIDGVLIRWDQQQQSGVIEIPFKLSGSVLDTATPTNDAEITFTLRECQDIEDAKTETFDTDTLTNFVGAATAEVVDIGV